MKKIFLVVIAVLLCTLVAAAKDTIYSFTLLDTNGNPYCNSMWLRVFTPGAPTPKVMVGGYYYNANCGGTYAPAGGFKHAISPYLQYNSRGAVLDVSTPGYGSFLWELLVNPVYHTWTGYAADDNYGIYLRNYGLWQNGYNPEVKGTKDASAR